MGFWPREVSEATGGRLLGRGSQPCLRVSTDSRRVGRGDLFVAIEGERYDGHQFVPEAAAAGAAGVLIARPLPLPDGIWAVLVDDTVRALGDLARWHRRRFTLPVVGVTGSTGKTSTKEMIAAIGRIKHRVVYTSGNYNNEIGLPLTVLALGEGDELLVLEMGMRGRGQIAALASIAEPNVGVVTNIGLTHLELLGSQEAIAEAKGELVAALPDGGAAVLNADDPLCRSLAGAARARVITYGLNEQADVRATNVRENGEGSALTIESAEWPRVEVQLSLPGRHHLSNALAAAATAFYLGYGPAEISAGLAGVLPGPGRGAVLRCAAGYAIIDDTYNANPASVSAALALLKSQETGGRKIAILGDMLELGPAAPDAHREVGKAAASAGLDLLLTTGVLAAAIGAGAMAAGFPARQVKHYAEKEEIADALGRELRDGDLVLIKGSRGMHLEELVSALVAAGGGLRGGEGRREPEPAGGDGGSKRR